MKHDYEYAGIENDHAYIWTLESAVSAAEDDWHVWIAQVEAILGHSADGDQREDGYSLGGFYLLWERGWEPTYAVRAIRGVRF